VRINEGFSARTEKMKADWYYTVKVESEGQTDTREGRDPFKE